MPINCLGLVVLMFVMLYFTLMLMNVMIRLLKSNGS